MNGGQLEVGAGWGGGGNPKDLTLSCDLADDGGSVLLPEPAFETADSRDKTFRSFDEENP